MAEHKPNIKPLKQKILVLTCYHIFLKRKLVLAIFGFLILSACDSPLEELINNLPDPGVKVVFDADLIQANQKSTSTTGESLQVSLTVDGMLHSMSVSEQEAWIDWQDLQIEPDTHLYEVSIFYPADTNGAKLADPILIATGNLNTRTTEVEFNSTTLHTYPYDIDQSGIIDQDEKRLLDADQDGMANLAEILIGGDPNNDAPTFLSPASINVPEKQKIAADSNYKIYTAKAISPRVDNAGLANIVEYQILNIRTVAGTSDAPFVIDSTSGDLYLDIASPISWPSYRSTNDNIYIITIEAYETNVGTQMELTINITDRFNLTATAAVKTLNFSWDAVIDAVGNSAAYYKLFEKTNASASFVQVSGGGRIETTDYRHDIGVHRLDWQKARYYLKAYSLQNSLICSNNVEPAWCQSDDIAVSDLWIETIGYVKHQIPTNDKLFGSNVVISADGSTLAVSTNIVRSIGEISLYTRPLGRNEIPTGPWMFATTLIDPHAGTSDRFGGSFTLSHNGRVLVVGAPGEDNSEITKLNAPFDCTDDLISNGQNPCSVDSGAVYIFELPSNSIWPDWDSTINNVDITYIKSSAITANVRFGTSVSLSGDGRILAISSVSSAIVLSLNTATSQWSDWDINLGGGLVDKTLITSVSLYPTKQGQTDDYGNQLILSHNGKFLAVGAASDNYAVGANETAICTSDSNTNSPVDCADHSGAVYVYMQPVDGWINGITGAPIPGAYLKALNADRWDSFGRSISLSHDGSVLAVGAIGEDNAANATMDLAKDCSDMGSSVSQISCLQGSGAVYLYELPINSLESEWVNAASGIIPTYLKAPNAELGSSYGFALSLSGDATLLAIGALGDNNAASGTLEQYVELDPLCLPNGSCRDAGAVYVLTRPVNGWPSWSNRLTTTNRDNVRYLKAPNAGAVDTYGKSVSLSGNGSALAVGVEYEDSDFSLNPTIPVQGLPTEIINGKKEPIINDNLFDSGAVYLY